MEKRKMLAKSHADEFKKQNPRFSHQKFYAASGINPAEMHESLKEDSVTDNLVANVKDALMFLKIQGDDKVSTNAVFNEFKKRGIDVSLEQLQELFPQGNDFLKNITSSYVEFNNNQPEAPKSFSQVQDNKEKVGDMALSAFKKRK
jgi:hypothetical protein